MTNTQTERPTLRGWIILIASTVAMVASIAAPLFVTGGL